MPALNLPQAAAQVQFLTLLLPPAQLLPAMVMLGVTVPLLLQLLVARQAMAAVLLAAAAVAAMLAVLPAAA